MTTRPPSLAIALLLVIPAPSRCDTLQIRWRDNFLTIRGRDLPGGEMKVHYLEAFCRPGSTDREWGRTVIAHATELLSADEGGKAIRLRSTLADGVIVDHVITAGADEV